VPGFGSADAAQLSYRIDINHHCRLDQTNVHSWNQALAACQKARLITMLRFQL
jgi:hypothetical protein